MKEVLYKAGQRVVTGFDGYTLPDVFIQSVKKHKIGNVILFRRNIKNNEQLYALCESIQTLVQAETGLPALIAIDQEGGMVSRLPNKSAAITPGAQALAATDKPENAYIAGAIIAEELLALGINCNLAPDMDINSNPRNPVIGVRSFGDTPDTVIRFGTQMIHGLQDKGVLACAKHFPGHGDTDTDSHLSLPTVHKNADDLARWELQSFQAAIDAGVSAIMTSHIWFPQMEAEKLPATMSRRIIRELLLEEMGFRGLVFSDCMMMGAVAAHYGTLEGGFQAARAGVDLIFVSHDPRLAGAVVERIMTLQDSEGFEASYEKICAAKKSFPQSRPPLSIVGSASHREEARRMMLEAITPINVPPEGLPPLGANPLFCACYPFSATGAFNPSGDDFHFGVYLSDRLGGRGYVTSTDPSTEEIIEVMDIADEHSSYVMGTYNGMTNAGQLRLLKTLAETGKPTICVSLFNPYDLRELPPGACGLAAYEYSPLSLEMLTEVLRGAAIPGGKLPVKI